ncbi:MAG: RNB domain-containing ribonuclease [Bacilli bacterium]|nr:MAG: RNB domain-containing ribonuclease [Bacilli bacterium]
MLFIHNLEEELSKNKVIYLDKLSKYQDKNYVKEIMDRLKDINKVDTIELEKKYNISSIVKDAIIKEMESFHFDRSGRLELDVNFVTIDDQEALCLDDAISLVKNADGSYYYYVAITDIPSLIPYQSQTFYDALGRVETIYLIDKKNINLYHPNIANNLCSLLPNTKKRMSYYIAIFVDSNLNIDTNSLEIIRGIITVKKID